MGKLAALKAATAAAAQIEAAPVTVPARTNSQQAPSRAGKVNISSWMNPAYKASLYAIKAKFPDKTINDLMSEALNDLFTKYKVPVVRE